MNITPSLIYWITRLDYFGVFATVTLIIAFFALIMLTMIRFSGDADDEDIPVLDRAIMFLSFYVTCACSFCIFAPTTKEAAAMIVIPRVANSETVSNLKDLSAELIDLAHVWAKELKPSK